MQLESNHEPRANRSMWTAILTVVLLGQVAAEDVELSSQVTTLVELLEHGSVEESRQAEESLIQLGNAVLDYLPAVTAETPERTRIQLQRVRQALSTTTAPQEAAAKMFSIVGELTAAEAFGQLREQAGLRADLLEEFDADLPGEKYRFDVKEKSFWETVSVLLDTANLSLSPYSGDSRLFALAGDNREGGVPEGQVCVDGPFRFEASRLEAVRDLRNPDDRILRLLVLVFWEPQSTPVTLRHNLDDVEIVAGDESLQLMTNQTPSEIIVRESLASVDLEFPFELPPRATQRIERISGTITAVLPGPKHKFEFDQLGGHDPIEKKAAGVRVVVERARTAQNLQDVRLLIKLDNVSEEMQRHMSWIYNNIAYLTNSNGDRFDDVLTEIYQQDVGEIGVLYKYDAPGDISDYQFVYETPSGFRSVSAKYELRDIELP